MSFGDTVVNQCGNAIIDNRTATKATVPVGTAQRRRQRNRMVRPMHKVWTRCVPPLNPFPIGTVRVMLVENVVSAVPKEGPPLMSFIQAHGGVK